MQERQAAAELENVLDMELSSYNINVQTVADEVMVIQSLVLALVVVRGVPCAWSNRRCCWHRCRDGSKRQ